ncbi:MAG: hypothetical protein PHR28_04725 [candidate division Zixibacteria bacterium]|nr:hypothetical protein [candidate division Zixibacteria bacterium]
MKYVALDKISACGIEPVQSGFRRLLGPMSGLWNRHRLGLVITEDWARLALVRHQVGSPQLVDTQMIPFDRADAENWPSRIAKSVTLIHDYLHQRKLPRIPVNVALLGHDIGFRRLILPAMPANEMAAAVRWEGNKLFPFDLADCMVHHEIARRMKRDKADFAAINVVAAGHQIIEALYGQCQAMGVVLGQVNILPCFLSRLLAAESSIDRQACHLILYLDDDHSLGVFVVDGHLEFYQEFAVQPVGGLVGTASIDNISLLGDELISFLDLYHAQERDHTVQFIILCGKYAGDPRTAAFLAETTGLPCRPATGTMTADSTDAAAATSSESIAALLTALAPNHIHPLAPPAYHYRQEQRMFRQRTAVAAVVTLVGLAAWQYATYSTASSLTHRLETTRIEKIEFENSPAYRTFLTLSQSIRPDQSGSRAQTTVVDSRYRALLKEISLITPSSLTLSALGIRSEEGRRVAQLDGQIRLNDFSPEIVLARYVETLGNSPFFDSVTVISHQKQRDGEGSILNFQLMMDVRA